MTHGNHFRESNMTTSEPKFPFNIEVLDEFLLSEDSPEECMMISDLDGFLTAVAIGPKPFAPSQWLPVIWRQEEPAFKDTKQADQIIGMIFARYNEILSQLADSDDDYCPLFWESADGSVIAMDWAEGFMEGVQLDPGAWVPMLEDEEGKTILSPIIAHLHDEEGNSLMMGDPTNMNELYDQAAELIPSAVIAVNKFWNVRRTN
jgi:uncharacterized protein